MNDKILDTLKSTLLNNIYKVSLMDVFKDEVTFYKYSNNTLNIIDKKQQNATHKSQLTQNLQLTNNFCVHMIKMQIMFIYRWRLINE